MALGVLLFLALIVFGIWRLIVACRNPCEAGECCGCLYEDQSCDNIIHNLKEMLRDYLSLLKWTIYSLFR